MSVLFVEAYLARTRDERLRQDVRRAVIEDRRQLASAWLPARCLDPEATAAVLSRRDRRGALHRALLPGAGRRAT